MRCYSCTKLSLKIICDHCAQTLFKPTISTRQVGTLDVISFYNYTHIASLLHTKHKPEGFRIYKVLAQMTMHPFIKEFIESLEEEVYIIGIDKYVKDGYSHTALLTHAMQTPKSKPLHASLLAQNRVSYSGKDLQYRLENARDFHYTGKKGIDAILVDDIITTGVTLQEAQSVLLQHGVNVLFALTLADAKE